MMIPPTTTTQKIHTTRNRQRTTNNSDEATNRHPGSNEISYFHRRRLREPRTGTADTGGGGVGGVPLRRRRVSERNLQPRTL